MGEIWKDIKGFEGYFQWSNLFRFRSLDRIISRPYGKKRLLKGRIMNITKTGTGYPHVSLSKNGVPHTIYVHVFFATLFIPNPEKKPKVNHINGDKSDYSLLNLEWATYSEDRLHAHRTKLHVPKKGVESPMYGAKNKSSKIVLDTQTGIFYDCARRAAEAKNISYKNLYRWLNGIYRNRTSLIYA